MSGRLLARIGLAIAILVGLALGTARAREALSQSQAQSGANSARAAADRELTRGRVDGLLPAELAPYRGQLARIDARPRPSSDLLWGSASVSFYNNQAAAYRRLSRRVVATLRRVASVTRAAAANALGGEQRDLTSAAALGVDVTQAKAALALQRQAFSTAGTPGAFRSVRQQATAADNSIAHQVSARKAQIAAELGSDGGSVQGVFNHADAIVATARVQLSLLGVFTKRALVEGAALDRLNSAVHAQKSGSAAALGALAVQAEASAISADFAKTVPSKLVLVSTEDQWAHMYQDGREVYSTPVTTGGPELPTDHGIFHIYLKASPFVFHSPWPPGSPYYYPPTPITFWMPFNGGDGLHDASWRSNFGPGSNLAPTDLGTGDYILGTHGCVNLPYDAAQFVWDWAPVGTTVVVV